MRANGSEHHDQDAGRDNDLVQDAGEEGHES